ncbi:MAG: VCBS repeat-containing protein [Planctomycetaceae bacterium]|nr:VCBS repeat-containing protein [Planctomycetaceae bacterium]
MSFLSRQLLYALLLFSTSISFAEEHVIHQFDRQELTDVYYSEGINHGDLNGDGHQDIVHGPYWFAGPDFKTRHEIYEPKPQDRNRYADNFFSWVHDVNGDGKNDIFVVGFPGTPAYVYENPGPDNLDSLWQKHQVFDWVSNESPWFTDLVGDNTPELVCTRDGRFGYATLPGNNSFDTWTFHPISKDFAAKRFGHGLGVGDINGDGRQDIIYKDGWFEQPEDLSGDPEWKQHLYTFTRAGGAEMYAYDVDGDGDNDVISSLAAHSFGLAWFEQIQKEGHITFEPHVIMGDKPEQNPYGVLFSELHSVNLADMDGDGLKDIVTGKTYWSHHTQAPMWDAGAVVYWFKLKRGPDGVEWVPYKADGEAGIGRQVIVGDLNQDGLPEILAGGMKGANVLHHTSKKVNATVWKSFQPKAPLPLADGLTPEEAAERMTVPEGFTVQLAAGEPQVHQPIAMAFDHKGRLWVAEAHTYPRRAPEGEGKDKIIILEDTDLDGTLDSRKVFIDGLNLVSGMEVGFGGVWVGAAPYFMFIPDKDGDDKPDSEPQILLDGFGYQDTHETLNAFIWGPDGWLYGCHGVFTHSKVGKPGTPEEDRIPMNCAVWRYHPVRHEFDVFARGTSNPWGVDFNDRGHAFITACVIPHLWHIIPGARYHRQGGRHFNPYLFDDIKTIADHAHYVGNIRDHAWWGHEPQAAHDTLAKGGGHAHCGAMIYLGDNWPDEYRNQIFFNNIHGNRVNNDLLEQKGSGYVGHHGSDTIIANDRWYRGINLRYGPDGTVYVIDWYDKNACHRTNPEIWDRTNGRVFNVYYGEPERKQVDLAKMDDDQLVQLLSHKNEWYVRMARKILQERAAADKLLWSTPGQLIHLVNTEPLLTDRLKALWTLHAIGELKESLTSELLKDPEEDIRCWAIQLELEDRQCSPEFVQTLTRLASEDASPQVRLYLASALQRLPLNNDRLSLAKNLLSHGEDADDHNLPLMYWYGIEPLFSKEPMAALSLASASEIPLVKRYIYRRAAVENDKLGELMTILLQEQNPNDRKLILEEMLAAFEGRVNIPMPKTWIPAYAALSKSDDETIRDRADQVAILLGDERIFPRMRAQLVNKKLPLAKRRDALNILVRGRDPEAVESYLEVVREPSPLRGAAIRALAQSRDERVPEVLLSLYSELDAETKRDVINTLTVRPLYALPLFAALEAGQVPRTDLHAYNIRQLTSFDDKALNQKIKSVWGEVRESSADKQAEIEKYKQQLQPDVLKQADLSHGRFLFNKTCASCHTLFGEGGKVGPDITGSNRANLDYILSNVVDPSAVLAKDYRMSTIVLDDGRVVNGLIQKETDSALTVRTINDTVVVAKDEIEIQKLSELSMMPENQLKEFKPNEVRDLVAYLGSPGQVALKGPSAPIDPKTGKVPGAIEGESMKIVGKTGGTAKSQPMGNFKADRWSGNDHLWWTGAKPGQQLDVEFDVDGAGAFAVELVLTKAKDYGVVNVKLDGQSLGPAIDLYDPQVITTGVLTYGPRELAKGSHKLTFEIVGANPKAVKSFMVGLDYLRLVPATSETSTSK